MAIFRDSVMKEQSNYSKITQALKENTIPKTIPSLIHYLFLLLTDQLSIYRSLQQTQEKLYHVISCLYQAHLLLLKSWGRWDEVRSKLHKVGASVPL